MKPQRVLGLVLTLALGGASGSAVGAAETTAEEVLARYADAVGGVEKFRSLNGLETSGLYIYNGIEHPVVVVRDGEGRCREEIDGLVGWAGHVEPGKIAVRATDGVIAWAEGGDDEMPSPRAFGETATKAFLEDAALVTPLLAVAAGAGTAELLGEADVDGTPAYHLRISPDGGRPQHWYLRTSDFLPIKKHPEEEIEGFDEPLVYFFDDYRDVGGGVMVPFWVYIEEKIMTREYIFERAEVNPELDPALFVAPEIPEPDTEEAE